MCRLLNVLVVGALCLMPVPFTGCDSSKGRVTGKVTFDGQPVEGIGLVFNPNFKGGTISTGKTDAEGYYKAMFSHSTEGVLVGKHHVIFEYNHDEDDENAVDAGIVIPQKYTTTDTTPCMIEIKPGSNEFSYDINSNESR